MTEPQVAQLVFSLLVILTNIYFSVVTLYNCTPFYLCRNACLMWSGIVSVCTNEDSCSVLQPLRISTAVLFSGDLCLLVILKVSLNTVGSDVWRSCSDPRCELKVTSLGTPLVGPYQGKMHLLKQPFVQMEMPPRTNRSTGHIDQNKLPKQVQTLVFPCVYV